MNVKLAGVSVFATAITVASLNAAAPAGPGFKVQGAGFVTRHQAPGTRHPAFSAQTAPPGSVNAEPAKADPKARASSIVDVFIVIVS